MVNQDHKTLEPIAMDKNLPVSFLRLRQIIGDRKAEPPIQPIIPVSASAWWAGVKSGKYPKSIKIGPNTTVWRSEDIQQLVKDLSNQTKSAA